MSKQSKQHDKQFKLDVVRYVKEHPDLTQSECAKNLGIGLSTLSRWLSLYRNFDGDIPTVGSGHYASEEAKEIAIRASLSSCDGTFTHVCVVSNSG